ncbi:hypothetical protein P7H20_05105 [Paenibacillus larvae]|nr:hypothetical protein [Paenibacillus larvae]MDT2274384.1 hypothetical protein [Paenibacillus larvae]
MIRCPIATSVTALRIAMVASVVAFPFNPVEELGCTHQIHSVVKTVFIFASDPEQNNGKEMEQQRVWQR